MRNAQKNKKDEFFTQLTDIEDELQHYQKHFYGKSILMNANDYRDSNFWKYFYSNFKELGLAKIVATQYNNQGNAYKVEFNGEEMVEEELLQSGDFKSSEAIKLLEEADIVVTNPPFSMFRDYVAQLIKYRKKFIIMGNNNAVTYKDIFPLIKEEIMWLGHNANKTMEFRIPDSYDKWSRVDGEGNKYGKVPAISWYTNLDINKRNKEIPLTKSFAEDEYPQYDNYDAIEVSRVANIPMDYNGVMGVPITFLTRHNPEQFEILGSQRWAKDKALLDIYTGDVEPPKNDKKTTINGKETYDRIFIKKTKGDN